MNDHAFDSEKNLQVTEVVWRSFFIATSDAWKNRIGEKTGTRLYKLYKKESEERTPPKGATGRPAGQPGPSLPYIIHLV